MGGNDTILGGGGDDTLLGAEGSDVRHGEGDADTLEGGPFADLLYGDAEEAVKAYIVLKAGETATAEEIIAWCKDDTTGPPGYRVPKFVDFREFLPETTVGKILKRVLVDEEKQKAAAAGS